MTKKGFKLISIIIWICFLASGTAAQESLGRLIAFGDSGIDAGNIAIVTEGKLPAPPYVNGSFTNGLNYLQVIAEAVPGWDVFPALAGGTNYAFGGAQSGSGSVLDGVPNSSLQVIYSQENTPPLQIKAEDVILLSMGQNDLMFNADAPPAPDDIAGNMIETVKMVYDLGGRRIIIPTLFPIHLMPEVSDQGEEAVNYTRLWVEEVNLAMDERLEELAKAAAGLEFIRPDITSRLTAVYNNPGQYGLVNTTDSAYSGDFYGNNAETVPEPDSYLWWDGAHVTASVNRLIGNWILSEVFKSFFPEITPPWETAKTVHRLYCPLYIGHEPFNTLVHMANFGSSDARVRITAGSGTSPLKDLILRAGSAVGVDITCALKQLDDTTGGFTMACSSPGRADILAETHISLGEKTMSVPVSPPLTSDAATSLWFTDRSYGMLGSLMNTGKNPSEFILTVADRSIRFTLAPGKTKLFNSDDFERASGILKIKVSGDAGYAAATWLHSGSLVNIPLIPRTGGTSLLSGFIDNPASLTAVGPASETASVQNGTGTIELSNENIFLPICTERIIATSGKIVADKINLLENGDMISAPMTEALLTRGAFFDSSGIKNSRINIFNRGIEEARIKLILFDSEGRVEEITVADPLEPGKNRLMEIRGQTILKGSWQLESDGELTASMFTNSGTGIIHSFLGPSTEFPVH